METTIYIIKEADAYRFGLDAVVRLWEPESISRTWIRRVTIKLPDGFSVADNIYNEPKVYRDNESFELIVNESDDPVIFDHTANGTYIPLEIVSEGWD